MIKYLEDHSDSEKSLRKAYRKYAKIYHTNRYHNTLSKEEQEEVFKILANKYQRLLLEQFGKNK